MQKDTESEKNDLVFDKNASALKDAQQEEAIHLHKSQTKTAHALETYNEKTAADLLKSDGNIKETPEESRKYAATALSDSQAKSAAMLKDSQSKAAKALDDSQTEAAAALRRNHAHANEKHNEKNDVIAWLGGGYSAGNQDK